MTDKSEALRVLVVDDVVEMAEMIADELEARGYRAVAVSSGREAMRLLGGDRIDALVTDLRMPGVDGLQLLRVSRLLDPARPVILITAFDAADAAGEAVALGASYCLTKPFRLDALARALDEATGRGGATRPRGAKETAT
ncbi:MAG TPA: response regulator [Polyangiaceae bacterium]|jgi:CheY-like chemotaxis protein